MFRLLRVIIRLSNEPTQDSLIPSALWDQGYMFRLLRIIIRPSNEPTQDYLHVIPSALWD